MLKLIKRLSLILLFGFIWSQDTLITKKGVIYSGKIISTSEKYVEFLPQSFKYSTKVLNGEIKELINNSGLDQAQIDEESGSLKTYNLANSQEINAIEPIKSNVSLSSSNNFSVLGKILVTSGGLLIASCYLESDKDMVKRWNDYDLSQSEKDKEGESIRLRHLIGGLMIAIGSFVQIF
tara:strand:+ start:236 stop:772 length:537 start_codon:yes stop_codon:yes gene_type:complete